MSVDYKHKPEKHKYRVNQKTIDEIHKEHLDDFKKQHELIPLKKEQLYQLKKDLQKLEKERNLSKPINLNVEYTRKKNNLKKLISNLESDILKTESYKSELEYYSRTGDVIYDYYEITNGVLYGKNYEETQTKKTQKAVVKTNVNEKTRASKIEISEELMAITDSNKKLKLKRPVRKRNKK
jgi:hypothetical protein